MEISKEFINPLALTLASYDEKTGVPVGGLLFEEISLGLKRKLQKIHRELLEHSTQLQKDSDEITARLNGNTQGKDVEFKILLSEKVNILSEPAMISEIEKIVTKLNYDFNLIEMITK